jgi:hypothetical protein
MSDEPIVLSPLSLLGAIGDLPPEKRQALFRMMRDAGLDTEANYVLVPAQIYNDLVAIAKFAPKAMKEAHRQAKLHETYLEQVAPYKNGPKRKANRKRGRNELIDQFLAVDNLPPGEEDWRKIRDRIRQQNGELLQGKQGKEMTPDGIKKQYLKARPEYKKALQESRKR